MRNQQIESLTAACQCGQVVFHLKGPPILAASCYCTSCQRAGHRLEQLPSAPKILDPDGGTPVLLYRKDRVRCVTGLAYLEERRLKADSPTRRVFATCCNSAMFGEFAKGHWLSLYRKRVAAGAPPLQMRIMTRERPQDVVFRDDVPSYGGFPGPFALKLLGAWVVMGFRKPDMGMGHLTGSTF